MASQSEILNKVETTVKKAKGRVSPSDIVAETGYALTEVNDTLKRLLELYESKVTMNKQSGEVAFYFKYPLVKRASKSLKEQMFVILTFLWKTFQTIYKASIAVILVVYTVIFAIILLFLMSRGSNNDRDDGSRIVGALFRAIFEALRFVAINRALEYYYDPSGMRYKQYAQEENKGVGFIQSVFQFVFGPDMPKYDPLNDDKELLAYIRKIGYKISSAKIIELTGVNYDEADSRLARYISKFDGEAYINSDNVLIVEFPRMTAKVSNELLGGKIEYYKDEIEPPYELTGNSPGRNFLIGALNIFNLIMSLKVTQLLSPMPELNGALWAIGLVPLVFSALFFLIPLMRIPYIKKQQKMRRKNIIRKKLIGAIAYFDDVGLPEKEIFHYAKITPEETKLAESVLKKLLIELNGEVNLNANGAAIYSFPRFYAEMKAVK